MGIIQETRPFRAPPLSRGLAYAGEAVYLYAFDVAYDMARDEIPSLLGQTPAQFRLDISKRSPRHLFFYKPQMVRLPPIERIGPFGPVRIERAVKLLPVGAISLTIRVPFSVQSIDELVVFHDLQFKNGSLHDEVLQLAEAIRLELQPYAIRPVDRLADEEAYTVFCVHSPLGTPDGDGMAAEPWLAMHRREVAALLAQEPDMRKLSEQEVAESTSRFLTYYDDDLVVIDWDAALLVDEPKEFEESLYIMELANLQLAELEAYDKLLDVALERSYRDLRRRRFRRGGTLAELKEIRVDLARFSDELLNTTKFFGDWHLARLYETLAARFHLSDWHKTIHEKLKTLDNLYELLKTDQTNRLMLMLELGIVFLFLIDIVLLFFKK